LYCDYFIWCVSCTVVVFPCFVICGVCMCGFCNVWVCVCMGFVMCGCVYIHILFMFLFNFVSYVYYCYVYVFLLLCMFCSVYSVFIVPTGPLRIPCLRFSRAFSSVEGKYQGITRKDGARPARFPD